MADNKVSFGLSKIYIAPLTEDDGASTYGTPVAIPGAVSMTLTPSNEEISFEADNDTSYFSKIFNDGYDVSLTMALIPDWFKIAYLGYTQTTAGLIQEDPNGTTANFAVLWQVDGDTESTRFVLYKCVAGRPTLSPATGHTPAGQELPIVTGLPAGLEKIMGYCTASGNATAYAAWFTSVQQADPAEASGVQAVGEIG